MAVKKWHGKATPGETEMLAGVSTEQDNSRVFRFLS